MSPVKSSFFAAAGVTVAALAVVFGSALRERIDLGRSFNTTVTDSGTSLAGLVASRSKDGDVPEGDFFREMVRLLKREYVEPISDDRKLAVGAVKGMVNSLKDPRSMFMDPDQFRTYMGASEGRYEGIGVDLAFQMVVGKGHTNVGDANEMDPSDVETLSIPRLSVVSVTPGGPADQAGVKPGDWVDSVDGHWVLNPDAVAEYRTAVLRASPKATKALSPEEAKARQAAARTLGAQLRAKLKTMLMPLKARDRLIEGASGEVKVTWHHGGTLRETAIVKRPSRVAALSQQGDAFRLRFTEGAAERLRQAIAGKSEVTLDLRENVNGSFAAMQECLSAVAPAGIYGEIHSAKPNKSKALRIATGNAKPPKLNLIVDDTTRGAASIFAQALVSRRLAQMTGKPSSDAAAVEIVGLPDGSGYTLVTGEYLASAKPEPVKRAAMKPRRRSVAMRDENGTIIAMNEIGGNA